MAQNLYHNYTDFPVEGNRFIRENAVHKKSCFSDFIPSHFCSEITLGHFNRHRLVIFILDKFIWQGMEHDMLMSLYRLMPTKLMWKLLQTNLKIINHPINDNHNNQVELWNVYIDHLSKECKHNHVCLSYGSANRSLVEIMHYALHYF